MFYACAGLNCSSTLYLFLLKVLSIMFCEMSMSVQSCLEDIDKSISAILQSWNLTSLMRACWSADFIPSISSKTLACLRWEVLNHTLNSYGLSPCDFRMIPSFKQEIEGMKLINWHSLAREFNIRLRRIAQKGFLNVFETWLYRHGHCTKYSGKYF